MINNMTLIKRILCALLVTICISVKSHAATITAEDRQILTTFWTYAQKNKLSELAISERVPIIARFFLDKPYKSGTLIVTKDDLPVINLRELDCVTLVDNVLALAYLTKYDDSSTEEFIRNITKLRYRNSEIIDYTSQLHYSGDWFYEMQHLNLLIDKTKSLGGKKYPIQVYFMTKNYTKYPVLANNPKLIPRIKAIEAAINKRAYYYIPKDNINRAADKIAEGDVILITTNIKGLDTSHLGFAVRKNGKLHLLHASSSHKKVMITENLLQDYMLGISSQTGIMVGRCSDVALPPH